MSVNNGLVAASLGVLALTGLTPAAAAQLSREGGAIEITADRGELDDVQRRATYIGDVDVIQGDARLRAKKVVISYSQREAAADAGGVGSSVGDIRTITADEDVYYITSREKVKADNGVYNAENETITLIGNVRVTNADGVIAGEKLEIDINSGRYVMDGGTGRVTTVIDQAKKEPIQ